MADEVDGCVVMPARGNKDEALQLEKTTELGPGGDAGIQQTHAGIQQTLLGPDKGPCHMVGAKDSGSPSKPVEEAACPDEDAHSKAGSDIGKDLESSRDLESPVTMTSVSEDQLLTKQVMEAESKAEEQDKAEEAKEEEEVRKRKELWSHMDEETKEMRYQRLQCLLMKSNMYTEYLIKRMERQKEEETKRRERLRKKAEKKERLKEQDKQNQEKENEQKTEIKTEKDVDEGSSRVPENTENSSKAENPQKSEGSLTSPRRTKSFLRAPVPKSQLSPGKSPAGNKEADKSQEGGAEDIETGSRRRSSRVKNLPTPAVEDTESKRGRKRKNAQYDEQSPQSAKLLTHFFKPSAKKAKLEENIQKSENKVAEQVSVQSKTKKIESKPFDNKPIVEDDGTIVKPALFDGGELRRYQIEGLNWLKILFDNGVNGILADEMGLGKTIQIIAMISQIVTIGASGPFLIVAPLSTLPNWMSEFKRFASRLPVVFYHGHKDERVGIRRKIRKQHEVMPNISISPVVVTSYEMAIIDRQYLKDLDWTYLIVDEGHRLKNSECRLIRDLKTYRTAHRLLLTGTPLQNNLRELWSLLNFLLPEIFDDLGSFETWFDVEVISNDDVDEAIVQEEKKRNILGMLHQILTPFMLRRVKSDVDLKIPPKKELLVYAPMTSIQEEFYRTTVDRTILKKIEDKENPEEEVEVTASGRAKRRSTKKSIDYSIMMEGKYDVEVPRNKKKDEKDLEAWVMAISENNKPLPKEEKARQSQVNIRLQNIMMQLRKVCNHPYLLQYPLDPKTGDYKIDEDVVKKCGKMLLLEKMLMELKKRGHKVLLFSQMTKMLDIIEDFCWLRKLKYCRLDGSTAVADRQKGMEQFNKDPSMFLYLLSTRAGGLGINLTGADTVIIYDSDWNPQNDLQAQDRCHRIGQTKPVMVYRFVTANTIDQRIVERAAAKRKLEKMVIQKGKFKSGIRNFTSDVKPLSSEELMKLLKSKDHSGTVRKGKGDTVISKEDLDALMDRSDLWSDFEKIKRGIKLDDVEEDNSTELRTSSKESSKLFSVLDYDKGGVTLDKPGPGEATPGHADVKEDSEVSEVKMENGPVKMETS